MIRTGTILKAEPTDMRARRTKSPRTGKESDIVAAVDIGASKSLCLIAWLADGPDGAKAPEIIGVGMHGANAPRATGRLSAAEASLRAAIEAAERMAGERVRSATVAMGGRRVICRRIGVDLEVEGGRVTQEDMGDCLSEGAAAAAGEGSLAIHALPIGYSVDGEDAGRDPRGLAGATLTAEVLGVGVREAHADNVEALLERCNLGLEDIVAAPYAAGEAVLLEDEKDLGVVLIDIGEGSTGYAVYEAGALVDVGGAPLGGGHITRDIAQIFGAPVREAERLKTLHGAALIGPGDEHRLVEMRLLAGAEESARITRAELSAVITPRLEEILELVLERLPSSARARHGLRRAVLTGGGSLLVGAREAGERILGMKTRLGRPTSLAGAPDAATAPQFSACAGAVQLAARARAQGREARRDLRAPARVASGGVLAGVGAWLRDNF
ncbi:MAG: cell division protein FtsA [Pseudomonadota bacterium]|nr:cell division protein FtsA [Pseudomonadota bacterium]